MTPGAGQALAILAASALIGLGGNALREEPLPFAGSLDPPPEPEAGSGLPANSPEEALARWEEGAFFLDARPRGEWEAMRVSGSFSFDADEFEDRYFAVVADFGVELPLFVYGAGPDSHSVRKVVAKLLDFGHTDVGFVTGGLDALLVAGIGTASGAEEGMP